MNHFVKMMFKICCFIFIVCPMLVLGGGYPNFMESIEECRNETKPTQEEFFNVMKHEVPKTKGEECMLACVQKKMGFLAADNKMNLEKILESIDHIKNINTDRYAKLRKIYEDCKTAEVVEKDQCAAAKKFAECVYPKERALGPPPGHHHHGPPPPGHRRGTPPFNKNIEECKNKTGATQQEIGNVMRHELPKTKNEQCMLACMQKKWGYMSADNKIDLDKIKNRFRMMREHHSTRYNQTIQIYLDCKAIETTEADECVAAKNQAECIFPKEKLNYLPPVMKRNIQECRNITSATDAEIYSTIMKRDIPKTKSESCVLACVQKKTGIMNTDNTIAIQKLKNTLNNMRLYNEDLYSKSIKILDDCKALETKEVDECVAARKFAECTIPKKLELQKSMGRPVP